MSVTAYHFWSPTCAPCKIIKSAIDDLKAEFPEVAWLPVNTQEDKDGLAKLYDVKVVPTVVVVTINDDGEILSIDKHSGTNMAGYYRIIRNGIRLIQRL